MNRNRDTRNVVIAILCVMVVCMGVGFSYLQSSLQITGTANVQASTWNVGITSIAVCTSSDAATDASCAIPVGSATNVVDGTLVNATDPLKASFSATLTTPGDAITYKVVISNSGTLAAKVSAVSLSKTADQTTPLTFSYNNINVDDTLAPGATKTMYVTITYTGTTTTSTPVSMTNVLDITYTQAS